jgi:hypothetical protein
MPDLATLSNAGIDAKATIATAAYDLTTIDAFLAKSDDVGDLAHVLASLRDLRNTVAMLCDTAERRLAEAMPDRAVEVPGVGLVERHRKTSRKGWDNEALLRDLKSRLLATEDGEPLDGPSVLERVQEVFRLSGNNARVTALRDVLGVRELDEYCQEEALGYSVQIHGGVVSDVAKVLNDAADLIEPPGRWTKGAYALNARNQKVGIRDTDACCWCIEGAIIRVAPLRLAEAARDAVWDQIEDAEWFGSIEDWNDAQPSPESVIAALRAAAQAVES